MGKYDGYKYENAEMEALRKRLAELSKKRTSVGKSINFGGYDEQQFSKKDVEEYGKLKNTLEMKKAALRKLRKNSN